VSSEGFSTTVLPAASAGPSFHWNDAALQFVGHAAEVTEAAGGARHVQAARVAYRMAGVQRFQLRQFFRVGFDQVGQLEQQAPAFGRRHARPGGKGALRGRDRAVHVFGFGRGDGSDEGSVVRVEHVYRAAGGCVHETAVDKEFVLHGSGYVMGGRRRIQNSTG
jgi:hypothetical protein